MNAKKLLPFLFGAMTMLLLDAFWLGFAMKDFYRNELGELMHPIGTSPDGLWIAGVAVYVSMLYAIYSFVLKDAKSDASILHIASRGGVLGLLIYIVYEATNYAFIQNWPVSVIIVDVLWGVVLFSLTTTVMHLTKVRIQ
jgi:uncharacterized membrane protein